jgi:hypothetical protein
MNLSWFRCRHAGGLFSIVFREFIMFKLRASSSVPIAAAIRPRPWLRKHGTHLPRVSLRAVWSTFLTRATAAILVLGLHILPMLLGVTIAAVPLIVGGLCIAVMLVTWLWD